MGQIRTNSQDVAIYLLEKIPYMNKMLVYRFNVKQEDGTWEAVPKWVGYEGRKQLCYQDSFESDSGIEKLWAQMRAEFGSKCKVHRRRGVWVVSVSESVTE